MQSPVESDPKVRAAKGTELAFQLPSDSCGSNSDSAKTAFRSLECNLGNRQHRSPRVRSVIHSKASLGELITCHPAVRPPKSVILKLTKNKRSEGGYSGPRTIPSRADILLLRFYQELLMSLLERAQGRGSSCPDSKGKSLLCPGVCLMVSAFVPPRWSPAVSRPQWDP